MEEKKSIEQIVWYGPWERGQSRIIAPKLAIHLLEVWRKDGFDASIFKGEEVEQECLSKDHFQASLSGDQRQFRIWSGYRFDLSEEKAKELCKHYAHLRERPPYFGHVDSCGEQCLLALYRGEFELRRESDFKYRGAQLGPEERFMVEACKVLGLDHAFYMGPRRELRFRLFLSSDDHDVPVLEKIGQGFHFEHDITHLYKDDIMKCVFEDGPWMWGGF